MNYQRKYCVENSLNSICGNVAYLHVFKKKSEYQNIQKAVLLYLVGRQPGWKHLHKHLQWDQLQCRIFLLMTLTVSHPVFVLHPEVSLPSSSPLMTERTVFCPETLTISNSWGVPKISFNNVSNLENHPESFSEAACPSSSCPAALTLTGTLGVHRSGVPAGVAASVLGLHFFHPGLVPVPRSNRFLPERLALCTERRVQGAEGGGRRGEVWTQSTATCWHAFQYPELEDSTAFGEGTRIILGSPRSTFSHWFSGGKQI